MLTEGQIVEVSTKTNGSGVHESAAAGAVFLQIENNSDFVVNGGQFIVEDAETDIYTYEVEDDDSEDYMLISIDPPLLADVDQGTPLSTYPVVRYKVADVDLLGSSGVTETISDVRFLHILQTAVQEGPRTPGNGEFVVLSNDFGLNDDLRIINIDGSNSHIYGENIIGSIPTDALTDGEAPDIAPFITAEPFSVGSVRINWLPIANNGDPVTYEVWASVTSPVDTSEQPIGSTNGTQYTFSQIDGVQIPIDGTTPVYVVVRPKDADGPGPFSNEVSAVPKQVDVGYISALLAEFLQINAWSIDAAEVNADVVWASGSFTIGDPLTSHISGIPGEALYLYDTDGQTPIIQLRMDGKPSVFRGQVIADDVSVMNGLILKGIESVIATNARLTLLDSIRDPQDAPSLLAGTVNHPWRSVSTGYQERSMAYDPTDDVWWQSYYNNGVVRAVKVNRVTGAASGSSIILGERAGDEGQNYNNGFAKFGSFVYTVRRIKDTAYADEYIYGLYRYNATTGAYSTRNVDDYYATFSGCCGMTEDGEIISIADGTVIQTWGSSLSSPTSNYYIDEFEEPFIGIEDRITFISRGMFHYGVDTIVIATSSNFYVFDVPPVGDNYLTLRETIPTDGGTYGGAHDGDNFFTCHNNGKLKKYSTWETDGTDSKWWAGNTEGVIAPGVLQTELSPKASITLPNWRYLTITPGPKDNQTTHYGYYIGNGAAEPALASMHLVDGVLKAEQSITIFEKELAGPTPPVDSDYAGASGDPGEIVSQTGGLMMNGSGDFSAPRKIQAGIDPGTIAIGQVIEDVPVTFEEEFEFPPSVVANIYDTTSTHAYQAWAKDATTVGFTLHFVRYEGSPTTAAVNLQAAWHAVARDDL